MPHYLVKGAATPEYWQGLVRNPENRREAVRRMIEANGGKLEAFYFAFGEDDFIAIIEMPNNASAAALAIATSVSGRFKSFTTTVLITAEEMMEIVRKVQGVGYRPPGS